jgi:hypothetical protein
MNMTILVRIFDQKERAVSVEGSHNLPLAGERILASMKLGGTSKQAGKSEFPSWRTSCLPAILNNESYRPYSGLGQYMK